jgi:hypothetical protein
MRSIRLTEWVIAILNETIRADAEFQLNQRNAWIEFSNKTEMVDGIDITAGFQHQRSLLMKELTFDFDLIPDVPRFWDKVLNLILFRQPQHGYYYRLKKKGETGIADIHVKMIIKRDQEERFQQEVILDPKDSPKAEDIHVVDVAR